MEALKSAHINSCDELSQETERKNILHIRDSAGIYGAERVILTLGKNINRQNFNFMLLCMRRKDGRSEKLISKARQLGIHVIPVNVKGRIDIFALLKIRKILKENNISLFHSHDYKSDIYGLLATVNLEIRRAVTAHGSTRDSLVKRLYLYITERFIYRFIDKIIAVSEDVARQLIKARVKPENIEIIQNGIDISLISDEKDDEYCEKPLSFSANQKIFAVIGRLFPDKGHCFFLKAFSKVIKRYPYAVALILGDGPAKDEIEQQVRELKLENHVCLSSARSDMKSVYERIDFLIIPSLREGLPYVLLEAMASRVPVLATAVGDIPLLIDDNVTGCLVKPGDETALETRMIEQLDNPERSSEMAERAFNLVNERFSEKRMVNLTERLYCSLLA